MSEKPKREPRKRQPISMPEPYWDRVRQEAERRGLSVNAVMVLAVEAYLGIGTDRPADDDGKLGFED